jgi:hypothetical protein
MGKHNIAILALAFVAQILSPWPVCARAQAEKASYPAMAEIALT